MSETRSAVEAAPEKPKPGNVVKLKPKHEEALRKLIDEPNAQASSSRIGRLLGYGHGCHAPGGAILRALERKGLVGRLVPRRWESYLWYPTRKGLEHIWSLAR